MAHRLVRGAHQKRLFFSAVTDERGREIWMSDGADAGTTIVLDINPSAPSSDPKDFLRAGNTVYSGRGMSE